MKNGIFKYKSVSEGVKSRIESVNSDLWFGRLFLEYFLEFSVRG